MSVFSSYPINIGTAQLHTHWPLCHTSVPLNNAIDSYSYTISSLAPTPPYPAIPCAPPIAWFPDGTSKPPLPKSIPSNLTLLLIPRFQLLAPLSPRTSAYNLNSSHCNGLQGLPLAKISILCPDYEPLRAHRLPSPPVLFSAIHNATGR